MTRGVEPGDAGFSAASKILADLQRSFAAGLVVTWEPAPEVQGGTTILRGTWSEPGKPQKTVKMWLDQVGSTWYWEGWIDVFR